MGGLSDSLGRVQWCVWELQATWQGHGLQSVRGLLGGECWGCEIGAGEESSWEERAGINSWSDNTGPGYIQRMRDSTIARAENRALLNRTYAICAITRENFDVIRSNLSSTALSIRPAPQFIHIHAAVYGVYNSGINLCMFSSSLRSWLLYSLHFVFIETFLTSLTVLGFWLLRSPTRIHLLR